MVAFDDGVRTTLVFGVQQPLPAVFVRESDGSEGLVNFTVEGTSLILHRISDHWVLRRGRAVGCLWRGPAAGSPGTASGGSTDLDSPALSGVIAGVRSAGHAPPQAVRP